MEIKTELGKVLLDGSAVEELVKLGHTEDAAKGYVRTAMQEVEGLTVIQQRQQAYKQEADPLFIEWQFDQTPEAEQAWRAKVEEIKARYPKPAA
ncbi:hypothetical protein ABMY35_01085 [Pseudoalteromonas sp. BZB3]|uniref:hypothetical protein n=1 Tax=Pseudoalteromonas sp. BZB3 TaxID=3136670 RepID=UPI0032C4770C